MTLIQFFLAVPVALLAVLLFHDFMAGLGEDRLWGPPLADEELPAGRSTMQVHEPSHVTPVPALLKKAS
ncbi:MAG TPA: hypothetical protein VHJ78_05365 [Actinomycetota bacterium]|nr:hypothetical protein [Actinomycetota bacterium]